MIDRNLAGKKIAGDYLRDNNKERKYNNSLENNPLIVSLNNNNNNNFFNRDQNSSLNSYMDNSQKIKYNKNTQSQLNTNNDRFSQETNRLNTYLSKFDNMIKTRQIFENDNVLRMKSLMNNY
jgi:hypothetical protein